MRVVIAVLAHHSGKSEKESIMGLDRITSTPRTAYKILIVKAETLRKTLYDVGKATFGYFEGRRTVERRESSIVLKHNFKIDKYGEEWCKYNSDSRTTSEEQFSRMYKSEEVDAGKLIDMALDSLELELYNPDDYPIA